VSRIVALSSVIRGNGSEIVALSSACHIVVWALSTGLYKRVCLNLGFDNVAYP
jgi:hypothetical protein